VLDNGLKSIVNKIVRSYGTGFRAVGSGYFVRMGFSPSHYHLTSHEKSVGGAPAGLGQKRLLP